jgi:hypothetical protein
MNKRCLHATDEVLVHKTLLKIIEEAVEKNNKKLLPVWRARVAKWEADPVGAAECPYIPTHTCKSIHVVCGSLSDAHFAWSS